MFFEYNNQLGPPFHVIVHTNFVNFAIKNTIDIMTGFMDCLYAKGTPGESANLTLEQSSVNFKIRTRKAKI